MYTLYYTTRSYTTESTALVPRIALEEIGAPYRVVEVELEPVPPDWYLALNPHGKIPALAERQTGWKGEALVYPASAILLYLADRHPEARLMPSAPAGRAAALRSLLDMAEMVQSSFMMFFYPERFSIEAGHAPAVRRKALDWLGRYFSSLDKRLAAERWLSGERYSVCDIYLYVLARWLADVQDRDEASGLPRLKSFPALAGASARIEARPAVARSLAADDIAPIAPAS